MTTFIFDDIRAKTEKRLELVRMVSGDFFLGKRQFCEKATSEKKYNLISVEPQRFTSLSSGNSDDIAKNRANFGIFGIDF